MPNLCENHTNISGPLSEVQKLYSDMFARVHTEELEFAISNLMPCPKELIKTVIDTDSVQDNNNPLQDKYSWYYWCMENWGTKWGDYDHFYVPTEVDVNGDFGYIEIKYQTAWSPFNEEFWSKVSEKYPNCLFTTTYFEGGMDFLGAVIAKNGYTCAAEDSIDFEWDNENNDVEMFHAQYDQYLEFVDDKLSLICAEVESSLFEVLNEMENN